jgi:hypothetical protein
MMGYPFFDEVDQFRVHVARARKSGQEPEYIAELAEDFRLLGNSYRFFVEQAGISQLYRRSYSVLVGDALLCPQYVQRLGDDLCPGDLLVLALVRPPLKVLGYHRGPVDYGHVEVVHLASLVMALAAAADDSERALSSATGIDGNTCYGAWRLGRPIETLGTRSEADRLHPWRVAQDPGVARRLGRCGRGR